MVHRFAAVAVGVVLVASLAAAPAWAGNGTATTPYGTATVSIPDVFLDGPGVADSTVSIAYSKHGAPNLNEVMLSFDLTGTSPGSEDEIEITNYTSFTDPATGVVTYDLIFEGFGSGARTSTFTVTGSMKASYISVDGQAYPSAPFTPATFTVTRSRTILTRVRAQRDPRYVLPTRISANVVAVNSKGLRIPVDGDVVVEAQKPHWNSWVRLSVASSLDDFGKYSAAYNSLPSGTKIRVRVVDCGWCTDASSQVTLR